MGNIINPYRFMPPELWFAADQGITKDGSDRVSQWDDLSGNGNHLTQSTDDYKPIWTDAQINGLPILRFDGTDDYMDLTYPLNFHTYTVFVVYKKFAVGDAMSIISSKTQSNNTFVDSTNAGMYTLSGGTYSEKFNQGDNTSYVIVSAHAQPGINNDFMKKNNAGTSRQLSNATTDDYDWDCLGVRLSTEYSKGDVVEILLFNELQLTNDSQRLPITEYLNAKYSIY